MPAFVQRLPITAAALDYAERLHAGQTRDADGAAFIEHPLEVASLLHESGAPDDVVAAGVLHDTLEKTAAEPSELRPRFGDHITNLVLAVTEDDRIGDYDARKAALLEQVAQAGPEAQMVFAADKVSKVRELRLHALNARSGATRSYARYLTYYRDCLRVLETRMPSSRLVSMLRRELATSGGALLQVGVASVPM
jgi:(p)ppGpp synthase/HD superfamily hydrolase